MGLPMTCPAALRRLLRAALNSAARRHPGQPSQPSEDEAPVQMTGVSDPGLRVTPTSGRATPIGKGVIKSPAAGSPNPIDGTRPPRGGPPAVLLVRPPSRAMPATHPSRCMSGRRMGVRACASGLADVHNAACRAHTSPLISEHLAARGEYSGQG